MTSVIDNAAAQSNQASASPSSFYAAMRILPAAQRDAMFLIYNYLPAGRRHRRSRSAGRTQKAGSAAVAQGHRRGL